jgi:aminopeptidase N
MPISIQVVETAFVLAEMKNSINFFSALFGQYPFPVFRATVHPFGFGQGLPTMLMIPKADQAEKNTFSFISHETSHQWWGHIVLWRSYRDQWLSEGFARYSGLLYTGRRDRPESVKEMLKEMRESLRLPPATALGMGSGRLTDVGPLTMGHRLATRETADAYQALIYNKGGLVLRMLHFLFSDPATGADQPFYDMMSDFTRRFAGRSASTDDFRAVAAEHFVKTRVAAKFGMMDLDWFFQQWVFSTALPIYRLEYSIAQEGDAYFITGTVFQDGVPAGENWFMPLPLVVKLDGDKVGRALVYALGPETPVAFRIGSKPKSVELDPDMWVLSEKSTAKAVR